MNILENAVKYSDCQTKIVIRMIKMSVYLRIEFDDEGIGIPKKEWNRIFQRFYRGEAPKVQKTPGSGVGLYLAREITVRHGGNACGILIPSQGKWELFYIPVSIFEGIS